MLYISLHNNASIHSHRYLSSEQVLDIKPHGNSKTEEPYFRTSTNTIKSLKSNLKSASPKEALEKVSTERGGEMSAKSVGSLPRNHQQVYKTT